MTIDVTELNSKLSRGPDVMRKEAARITGKLVMGSKEFIDTLVFKSFADILYCESSSIGR